MLKTAFGEQAMVRSQTFHWFSRFKEGRASTDDDESSCRRVSSSTPEMIERVRQIIREDRRRTTGEVSMLVGISHGTCHKILTEDLKMRRVASKFVPRLLSVDQKQQRLDICLDLKENAANDPCFLSNVITGDETWVCLRPGNQNLFQSMEKSGVTSTEEGKAREKQHRVNVDLFL